MGFLQRKLMAYDHEEHCDSCSRTCPVLCSQIPPPDSNGHIKSSTLYLTITFSVLATAFLVLCVYYVRRRRSDARRRSQRETTETRDEFLDEDQDHGPIVDHHIWYINTIGLQPSIINSIAVFKYKKGEGLVEGTECSVCLSEFEEDENLRLLPKCSHAFHIPCIDTWLRSHTNCPLCRAPIVSNTTANNGPISSSPEASTEESDEIQVVILEDDDDAEESQRETDGGRTEGRVRLDEESEELDVENGVQPMRRSVSMDSSAASQISHAIIANGVIPEGSNCNLDSDLAAKAKESSNLDSELAAKAKESSLRIVPRRCAGNQSLRRLMCSSPIGRSLQNRPIFMKRSLSCNGKFSLPIRNTKGRNKNPPLRSF